MDNTVHYFITLIFFVLILVNIINLTKGTLNMNVPSDDPNGLKAKELMTAAEVITYISLLIILIFITVTYLYASNKETTYYENVMKLSGGENIYAAMRIITFSILMFISILVSGLCFEAAKYITKSNDPENYSEQYNLCITLGTLFFAHFIVFTSIQGFSYVYQYLKTF